MEIYLICMASALIGGLMLSSVSFEVAGVHCGFSLLLVCMMTGTIFCNICPTSEELMSLWAWP